MTWKELLRQEMEAAYNTTRGLFELVGEDGLEWKPETGTNWMTTAQLLEHLSTCGGLGFKGFATGDWGLPDGVDMSNLPPEEMLPPAEKMPAVESLDDAKRKLHEDERLAREILDRVDEAALAGTMVAAPWDPRERPLGHQLLAMIHHVQSHKHQLFYYLKLQGKPVNTSHLWGD